MGDVIRTGVVGQLNAEWDRLVQAGVLPTVRGPELDGCTDLAAVLEAIRAEPDRVLLALLQASHAGDALAARTVLQAMLPKVIRMSRRDGAAGIEEYLAPLWFVIATYPIERRPDLIAANLALDTLKQVVVERQRAVRWDRLAPVRPISAEGDRADREAVAVIETAADLELIDSATGRLLRSVYVDGLSSRQAADRHGGTPAAVRYHCSRAVRRLAGHADRLATA